VSDAEAVIAEYMAARSRFLAFAALHPEQLAGNDNIVGRIGEYLAICFLEKKGRSAQKVRSKSEKGHDLLVGPSRVSVKLLTSENANGRAMRLTDPWDELLLLEFDTASGEYQIGHLLRVQFDRAISENPGWSTNPIVKKTMLGKKGLIGRYGSIEGGKLVMGIAAVEPVASSDGASGSPF
jgi:hypothetical protein